MCCRQLFPDPLLSTRQPAAEVAQCHHGGAFRSRSQGGIKEIPNQGIQFLTEVFLWVQQLRKIRSHIFIFFLGGRPLPNTPPPSIIQPGTLLIVRGWAGSRQDYGANPKYRPLRLSSLVSRPSPISRPVPQLVGDQPVDPSSTSGRKVTSSWTFLGYGQLA